PQIMYYTTAASCISSLIQGNNDKHVQHQSPTHSRHGRDTYRGAQRAVEAGREADRHVWKTIPNCANPPTQDRARAVLRLPGNVRIPSLQKNPEEIQCSHVRPEA